MIKHNGKYYLLMISWPQGHPRREVCYRADKITGPYEKKVILETEFAGFNGVGQGTIVDDKDGNWYGIVFQDRGGVGRVLTLEPCTWKDGWPMLRPMRRAIFLPRCRSLCWATTARDSCIATISRRINWNCSGSGTTILWIMPSVSTGAQGLAPSEDIPYCS